MQDDVSDLMFENVAWTCLSQPNGLCPNASGNGDIDETTGVLASGDLLQYSLVATPLGQAPGTVSNTVTVENLDGTDPDTGNNTATDEDPLLPDAIFGDGFEQAPIPKLLRPLLER